MTRRTAAEIDRRLTLLGRDLALFYPGPCGLVGGRRPRRDAAPTVPATVDIAVVAGVDAADQLFVNRLKTHKGELAPLGHPEYGSRHHELIGQPNVRADPGARSSCTCWSACPTSRAIARIRRCDVTPRTSRRRDDVRIELRRRGRRRARTRAAGRARSTSRSASRATREVTDPSVQRASVATMSFRAEPFGVFVDDLVSSLTGGVTREVFRFVPEQEPFRLGAGRRRAGRHRPRARAAPTTCTPGSATASTSTSTDGVDRVPAAARAAARPGQLVLRQLRAGPRPAGAAAAHRPQPGQRPAHPGGELRPRVRRAVRASSSRSTTPPSSTPPRAATSTSWSALVGLERRTPAVRHRRGRVLPLDAGAGRDHHRGGHPDLDLATCPGSPS